MIPQEKNQTSSSITVLFPLGLSYNFSSAFYQFAPYLEIKTQLDEII